MVRDLPETTMPNGPSSHKEMNDRQMPEYVLSGTAPVIPEFLEEHKPFWSCYERVRLASRCIITGFFVK